LGPFTLWPYYGERNQRVSDPAVRRYLDILFQQMLDYRQKPLEHIAVISMNGSEPFHLTTDETLRLIQDVLGGLFLSAAVRNDGLGGAVSRENFQITIQNFQPGSDGWATQDGSYIHTTVGGMTLKDARFRLPGFVPRPSRLHYDERLLEGLLKNLTANDALADRIFRSLRWVSHAYANVDNFPYQNRILLLMIAFEILADQDESLRQDSFGEWLDSVWGITAPYKCSLGDSWAKGKGPYGEVGWWGVEFYRMRNAIVHGDDPRTLVTHDSRGRELFRTGVQVFAECVRQLLREKQFLSAATSSDGIMRSVWLSDKGSERSD
jgi:hypothetical protein